MKHLVESPHWCEVVGYILLFALAQLVAAGGCIWFYQVTDEILLILVRMHVVDMFCGFCIGVVWFRAFMCDSPGEGICNASEETSPLLGIENAA